MQRMNTVMPPTVIPFTNNFLRQWVEAYEYYAGVKLIDSLNLRNYQEKDLEEIGKILYNLRETALAEKAFREIMDYNPNNIQAKASLVDIYGNLQKYDKSIEILEEWIRQNPSDQGAKRRMEQYRQKLEEQNRNK